MFTKSRKLANLFYNSKLFSHKGPLKKNRPNTEYRCKFGFQNLSVADMMVTYEGDPEVWTVNFLKVFPQFRLSSNSHHLFDIYTNQKEYFKNKTTEELASELAPGLKELWDYIVNDQSLKENFLNRKHTATVTGTYKALACILWSLSLPGVDVLRIPRDHHESFGDIGFDGTALLIAMSYLVAKNFAFTTVGKKFFKGMKVTDPDEFEDRTGYFDGKNGYVPSFLMLTKEAIKFMEKLHKQSRKKAQHLHINQQKFERGANFIRKKKETMKKWIEGNALTRKLMSENNTLWVTEDEAVMNAQAIGLQYTETDMLRCFYKFCERIIDNCNYGYLRSVRAIANNLRLFLDTNEVGGRLWAKDGSLARFVKYLIYGETDPSHIKKFNFYI